MSMSELKEKKEETGPRLNQSAKPPIPTDSALKRSIKIHLFAFTITNIFLLFLNLLFTPALLWVIYPFFGWLIGVALHSMAVIIRKQHVHVKAVLLHVTVYLFTNLLLVVINYFNSLKIDWALFPLFFWGFALAAHIGFIIIASPQKNPPKNKDKIKRKMKTKLLEKRLNLSQDLKEKSMINSKKMKENALKKRDQLMSPGIKISTEPKGAEIAFLNDPIPKASNRKPKNVNKKASSFTEVNAPLTQKEREELKKTEAEVDVKKQRFTCIVHKGFITGANIYACPHCDTIYCIKCATALKKKNEKCWSCNAEFEL